MRVKTVWGEKGENGEKEKFEVANSSFFPVAFPITRYATYHLFEQNFQQMPFVFCFCFHFILKYFKTIYQISTKELTR